MIPAAWVGHDAPGDPLSASASSRGFCETLSGVRRLLVVCSMLLGLGSTAPVSAAPFEVILLPDTQHYSDSAANTAQFEAQTQWIVDHQADENITFATLVGDIVQNGGQGASQNHVEWDRATAAMDLLDGDLVAEPDGRLPYAAVPGNHDYDVVDDKTSATQYVAHFGPTRFIGRSWFVGSSPDGTNQAQIFLGDGLEFLSLGLEWRPSDAALAWAQGVLAAHPDLPTIVSTHEHLDSGNPGVRRTSGETPNGSGSNSGESVYRKLVEPYPQVFLVLSGHIPGGDGLLASTTALGRPVHEVLADYQSDPNGGNGWMQRIRFDPAASELAFSSFSPTYVPGVTAGPDRSQSAASNYTISVDVDGLRTYLGQRTVLHFRQGQGAEFGTYTGAVDTHVGDGSSGTTLPNVAYGSADNVRIDGDGDDEQGLLRFDGIIGGGAGRIPPGTLIERAVLTLTTEGTNSQGDGARLHRMLMPWDASDTWDSLGSGVQLGSEAAIGFDVDVGGLVDTPGTDSFDVTTSVQAWTNGAPNHGWVMQSLGSNRWEFRSSDWEAVAERPMLTVVFATPASAIPALPNPLLLGLALALIAASRRALQA